ncbi:hypothetical protein Vafri_18633, partial [Volvox africanus]
DVSPIRSSTCRSPLCRGSDSTRTMKTSPSGPAAAAVAVAVVQSIAGCAAAADVGDSAAMSTAFTWTAAVDRCCNSRTGRNRPRERTVQPCNPVRDTPTYSTASSAGAEHVTTRQTGAGSGIVFRLALVTDKRVGSAWQSQAPLVCQAGCSGGTADTATAGPGDGIWPSCAMESTMRGCCRATCGSTMTVAPCSRHCTRRICVLICTDTTGSMEGSHRPS